MFVKKYFAFSRALDQKDGLGRPEVTDQEDYDLIRYYDDRAIQVAPNQGKSVGRLANGRRG